MDAISIRGARTHNLKNISVDLPRGRYIVFTGVSGSGKSSLAFDTLYAEGERRYVESLSAYARQFLERLPRPEVDEIRGLPPAIAIDQKTTQGGARSTVGTATEVSDYLRLLFARTGDLYCPVHHLRLEVQSVAYMTDRLLVDAADKRLLILAPVKRQHVFEAQEARRLLDELQSEGYQRIRADGEVLSLDDADGEVWADGKPHDLEVVVDRLRVRPDARERIASSIENALSLADGRVIAQDMDSEWSAAFTSKYACPLCDFTAGELEPAHFSATNPRGACSACAGTGERISFLPQAVVADPAQSIGSGALKGIDPKRLIAAAEALGIDVSVLWRDIDASKQEALLWGSSETKALHPPFPGAIPELDERWSELPEPEQAALQEVRAPQLCRECAGSGLGPIARNVWVGERIADGFTFVDASRMTLLSLRERLEGLKLTGNKQAIGEKLIAGAVPRLKCLESLGLGYLTIARRANTLSGGESQRIRLAGQIGSGLSGVLYVLDEPSIGLHPRDGDRLIRTLKDLRDLGNTVVIVEHDEDVMRAADWIVDLGPGAGKKGGRIVAVGTPDEIMQNPDSVTGPYLSHAKTVAQETVAKRFSAAKSEWLKLIGASGRTLKNVTLEIPVGALTVVTGISGSGKSTLITDTLLPAMAGLLNNAKTPSLPFVRIEGSDLFDKVISVDQTPIGRTPRSNAATYTGLFTLIRDVFAQTLTARERGYDASRFSFNARGGRCEACSGDGLVRVEMQFLPDVFVTCDVCGGKRYNRETLECRWKGLSIADVLDLTVDEARAVFAQQPQIIRKLDTLADVGLGYIRLGQNAATFSGGEAQRVKLAAELARRDTGETLYILDEPTTGLHFEDTAKLLSALRRLTQLGNTVLVIEHDLAVAAAADWLIDMGPEGGDAGGEIVAAGTPRALIRNKKSITGPWLKAYFERA